LRSIEFDPGAFDDLAWWAEQDRAQAIRVIRLVRDTQRDPFAGIVSRSRCGTSWLDVGLAH